MFKDIFRKSLSLILILCAVAGGGGGLTSSAANPYVVKTYDLSSAGGGDTGSSVCAWVSTYDATHHWEQCSVHTTAGSYGTPPVAHTAGGIKGNKVAHAKSVVTTVACTGSIAAPIQRCTTGCGWSVVRSDLKTSHIPSGVWGTDTTRGYHTQGCSVCGNTAASGDCITASGVNLRVCGAPKGTCDTCKRIIDNQGHHNYLIASPGNSTVYCGTCGISVGTATFSEILGTNGAQVWDWDITCNYNITSNLTAHTCSDVTGQNYSSVVNSSTIAFGNKRAYGRYTSNISSARQSGYSACAWLPVTDGGMGRIHFSTTGWYDQTIPSYVSHSLNPVISGAVWSTQRDITAVFRDTGAMYDYLEIGLFNSSGVQLVGYGSASHIGSGNFSRTFRLLVDAPASGAEFLIRARDRRGLVGEKRITLSYTDAVAPVVTSLTGNTTTWEKTKTLRLTASEFGSGQVEMAFGSIDDYCLATASGNNYYRDFKFTGTTASPKEYNFLVKDTLGNLNVCKYTIGYLDNTLPSMTLSQNPNTLGSVWYNGDCAITVTLADEHSGLNTLTVPAGLTPNGNVSLGGAKSATRTFIAREPGVYAFTVTDIAGNSVTKNITIDKLDNINPNMNAA